MSANSVSPREILDIEGALARFGGDKELFSQMAGMLLEDVPPLFAQLGDAVDASDAQAVRMHAHAIKGLLAGCGGDRAALAAQLLEDTGQSGNLSGAKSLVESLETELELLTQALRAYQP